MKPLRIPHIQRGQPFQIAVDGVPVEAYDGETVATVLHASGIRVFRDEGQGHLPSRLYCNMGVCQQCLVTIDDQPNCQACKTFAKPGMRVKTKP
jgi:sarcosine oxidase subunit alpha